MLKTYTIGNKIKKYSLFSNKFHYKYASQLVSQNKQKLIGGWLFLAAAGVLGMIVLGGYTRLTHSGLSMTDWSPYTKKYPKTIEEWQIQFDKYKKCIEYQTVNRNISLENFKPIYTIEFLHRQMGMYLGYYFMLPFSYFLYRGYLTKKLRNRLCCILALGATQGLIGWWMVKSGLKQKATYQNRPRVSPYRLMTHLMMATTIYCGLFWHSLLLLVRPITVNAQDHLKLKYFRKIRITGIIMIKLLLLNILTGALVAGIDAGKVYNTWPLMNNTILPETSFQLTPKWKNFFENKALVQFNHRTMAYITQTMSLYLLYNVFKFKIHSPVTVATIVAVAMVNYQALSGILTLLNLVPSQRANLHQMTAILTLSSILLMVYLSRVPVIAPFRPKP